jgi:hypothetical protein
MATFWSPSTSYFGGGILLFWPLQGGNPSNWTAGHPVEPNAAGEDTVAVGSLWLDPSTPALWHKVSGIVPGSNPAGTRVQFSTS